MDSNTLRVYSLHYPQGNGEAERAVKTVKGLLRKSEDPYLSFLAYRSTLLECGYSSAQMLMSRTLRTTLSGTREQRIPKLVEISSLKEKDEQVKEHQKRNYDQHHRTRDLPPLESGETVWIPDRESEGTVREEVSPRSHIVETADGSYRRNRRQLVRLPSSDIVQETEPSEDAIKRELPISCCRAVGSSALTIQDVLSGEGDLHILKMIQKGNDRANTTAAASRIQKV